MGILKGFIHRYPFTFLLIMFNVILMVAVAISKALGSEPQNDVRLFVLMWLAVVVVFIVEKVRKSK